LRIEPLENRQLLSITVNTLFDEADGIVDGEISLRDAIAIAPSGETNNFSVSGTITLTLGELTITKDVTILGPGADELTIDASGNDPTPDSTITDGSDVNDGDGSRVFNIDGIGRRTVAISGLTLTGGDTFSAGGAINCHENLSLNDVTIVGNIAADGGGINFMSFGVPPISLTISESNISGNAVWFSGGGIATNRTANISATTISDRQLRKVRRRRDLRSGNHHIEHHQRQFG
jgi:hypothetical protein